MFSTSKPVDKDVAVAILLQFHEAICGIFEKAKLDIKYEVINGHSAKLVLQVQFVDKNMADKFASKLQSIGLKSKTNKNTPKTSFHRHDVNRHCIHLEIDEIEKIFVEEGLAYNKDFNFIDGFTYDPNDNTHAVDKVNHLDQFIFAIGLDASEDEAAEKAAMDIIAKHNAIVRIIARSVLSFDLRQINDPDTYRPSRAEYHKSYKKGDKIVKVDLKTGIARHYVVGSGEKSKKAQGQNHHYQYTKKYSATLLPTSPRYMQYFSNDGICMGWDINDCDVKEGYIFAQNMVTNDCWWLLPYSENLPNYRGKRPTTVAEVRAINTDAVKNKQIIKWNELLPGYPKKKIAFLASPKDSLETRLLTLFDMYECKAQIGQVKDIPVLIIQTGIEHKLYDHEQRLIDVCDVIESTKHPHFILLKANNHDLLKKIIASSKRRLNASSPVLKRLDVICRKYNIILAENLNELLKSDSSRVQVLTQYYKANRLDEIKLAIEGSSANSAVSSVAIKSFASSIHELLNCPSMRFDNAAQNKYLYFYLIVNDHFELAAELMSKITRNQSGEVVMDSPTAAETTAILQQLAKQMAMLSKNGKAFIDHVSLVLLLGLIEGMPISCQHTDDETVTRMAGNMVGFLREQTLSKADRHSIALAYAEYLGYHMRESDVEWMLLIFEKLLKLDDEAFMLMERIAAKWIGPNQTTLLHLAVKHHKFDLLKYLTEVADISWLYAKNQDQLTPLQLAIDEDNLPAAACILSTIKKYSPMALVEIKSLAQLQTISPKTKDTHLDRSIMLELYPLASWLLSVGATTSAVFDRVLEEKDETKKLRIISYLLSNLSSQLDTVSSEHMIGLVKYISNPERQLAQHFLPVLLARIKTLAGVSFDSMTENPLYAAIELGDRALLTDLLINKGLNTNLDAFVILAITKDNANLIEAIIAGASGLTQRAIVNIIRYAIINEKFNILEMMLAKLSTIPLDVHKELLLYGIKHINDANVATLMAYVFKLNPDQIDESITSLLIDAITTFCHADTLITDLLLTSGVMGPWIKKHEAELIDAALKIDNYVLIKMLKQHKVQTKEKIKYQFSNNLMNDILCLAIHDDDLSLVKELFAKPKVGADSINTKDKDGMTPFTLAIALRKMNMIDYMLRRVSKPEDVVMDADTGRALHALYKEECKNQELHYAVESDNLNLFACLCSFGADINQLDADGYTVIELAIAKKRVDFMQAIFNTPLGKAIPDKLKSRLILTLVTYDYFDLAEKVFDNTKVFVMQTDAAGRNALHYVARSKLSTDGFLVKLLQASKSSMAVCDNNGHSPFQLASAANNKPYLNLMIDHASDSILAKDWNDYIKLIVRAREYDKAKKILRYPFTLTEAHGQFTTLHYILSQSNIDPDLCVALCEHGASLMTKSAQGVSVIDYLSENKHFSVVPALLPYIIRQCDPQSIGRLVVALIKDGNEPVALDVMKQIQSIDIGFNVSFTDRQTVLHASVSLKCYALIEEIVKRAVAIDHEDLFGDTAMMLAIRKGLDIDVFMRYPQKITIKEYNSALALAAMVRHEGALSLLLSIKDAKFDPQYKDKLGNTALHYLATQNLKGNAIIQTAYLVLLRMHANVEMRNNLNKNVIDLLIENKDITETLLTASLASIPIMNSLAVSHWLLSLFENKQYDLIDSFMSSVRVNVNLNATNARGETPLHIAVFHQQFSIAMRFSEAGADLYALDDKKISPLTYAIHRVTSRPQWNPELDMVPSLIASSSNPSAFIAGESGRAYVNYMAEHKHISDMMSAHFFKGGYHLILWLCINGAIPDWELILGKINTNHPEYRPTHATYQAYVTSIIKVLLMHTVLNDNNHILLKLPEFLARHQANLTLKDLMAVRGKPELLRSFRLHYIDCIIKQCQRIDDVLSIIDAVNRANFCAGLTEHVMYPVITKLASTRLLQLIAQGNQQHVPQQALDLIEKSNEGRIFSSNPSKQIFLLFKSNNPDDKTKANEMLRKEEGRLPGMLNP